MFLISPLLPKATEPVEGKRLESFSSSVQTDKHLMDSFVMHRYLQNANHFPDFKRDGPCLEKLVDWK